MSDLRELLADILDGPVCARFCSNGAVLTDNKVRICYSYLQLRKTYNGFDGITNTFEECIVDCIKKDKSKPLCDTNDVYDGFPHHLLLENGLEI